MINKFLNELVVGLEADLGVKLTKENVDFISAILSRVDSYSWREGYNDAKEDYNIF